MTVFPTPFLGRNAVYRGPINYIAFRIAVTGTVPNSKTTMDMYASADGRTYRKRPCGGDLASLASVGTIRAAQNAENTVAVGGRVILTIEYQDQSTSESRALILTSDDGWSYQLRSHPLDGSAAGRRWVGICRFGTDIIALLSTGETVISSDNGDTWALGAPTGISPATGIAASASAVVAIGGSGALKSSADPRTAWTARDSKFGTDGINAIGAASTQFVIVGFGGKISTAPANGQTWTARASGLTDILVTAFNTGTRWYVAGLNSPVNVWRVSADGGATWGAPANNYWDTSIQQRVLRFVKGAGQSIIHWGAGRLAYTTDEINWQQQDNTGLPNFIGLVAAYRGA